MEPTFQVLPPDRIPPPPKAKSPFGWLGAGFLLLLKYKYVLLFLKTGGSMLLSIWIYSTIFGWPFAVGFVFMILIHEMGHVIAAKKLGIPISAPIFIPFMGAAIILKQNPRDAWTEALMAYGGPLAGGAGGGICWALALYFHSPLLMALASVTFVMNLFNLIPLPPLDGGRICAAVSPWFWILGLFLLLASLLFFQSFNAIFIVVLIVILALIRMYRTFRGRNEAEVKNYFALPWSSRLTMAAMYLGLIAALILGYWNASEYLQMLRG